MSKITLDNLSDNLKEYLEGLGLSEEQVLNLINENGLDEEELKAMLKDTMSITELSTNSKTVIGAINELFQSANNGKELIANAIGEPLNAEDTFSAMSSDINSLLSTFKTNMMNNGVTVESGDKFKSLIDKIATMVEEGEGKGVQFASGIHNISGSDTNNDFVITNLTFKPDIILVDYYYTSAELDLHHVHMYNRFIDEDNYFILGNWNGSSLYYRRALSDTYYINETGFCLSGLYLPLNKDINWFAIGVGEEDTTLRDSLASILENKGVDVTEEDDMASLITKVDEEFDNSISVIPGEEFILETVDIGQVFAYDDSEWYELPTWTDARYHTIRYNGSYRVTVHGTVDSNNGTWVRIKETDNNGNIIQVSDEVKIVYGTSLYNIDIQNVFKGNRLYIEIKSSSLDASISMTDFEVKMTLE